MTAFILVIVVVAILLLFVGGLVSLLKWMIWVGIVLLVLAALFWLVRTLTGRKNS
ncbi:hypothetical protein [Glaciibacter psychrotolerans]|uniref:Protein-S-isoprenylcysteine O-methyltransferase Ste14 n=1 Tax=Glaciibacter psychrotolerans TaxID=670054 RepID=A0A7Z0EBN8_9MICO|nr:hypothetical protein [Leifsonia psychrotolerans]NYJ18686.1 protein-S-isoprenylcysteine O-methyltransferase Ste14 [Leifsonia psychrotolerans]